MKFIEPDRTKISAVVQEYFKALADDDKCLVVIGANNGLIEDFLTKYLDLPSVNAILVEPIRHLYLELQEKFRDFDNIQTENVAIYQRNCRKRIYRLGDSNGLPAWVEGLGSFDRAVISSHEAEVTEMKKRIVPELVTCITFNALLKKYHIKRIHILQIDTEGYDSEIVRMIDFIQCRPDIVIVEYRHMTFYQYYLLLEFFEERNYCIRKNIDSMDLIAVDNECVQ
jgi:FkbM family methyltransferase